MTLSTFRRSRKNKSKRRGGNGLYNAAAASLLPLGLLVAQQYYKNRSNRKFKGFKKSLKNKKTKLEDPYEYSPRR
jgi:hypothetical protein